MKKQFKFSNTIFIKTFLVFNCVIVIVVFLLLIRSKWFDIQMTPAMFLIINSVFFYKTFSSPLILLIEIMNEDISIKYMMPLFHKRHFECKISDVIIEKYDELGFRGSKREVFILKFKDLPPFKILIDTGGWERFDLEEIEKIVRHR